MTELKPCPFCGGDNIYETFRLEHWYGTKEPIIFCNWCKAEFSVEDEDASPFLNVDEDYKWRKAKTAEAWNRRAEDA